MALWAVLYLPIVQKLGEHRMSPVRGPSRRHRVDPRRGQSLDCVAVEIDPINPAGVDEKDLRRGYAGNSRHCPNDLVGNAVYAQAKATGVGVEIGNAELATNDFSLYVVERDHDARIHFTVNVYRKVGPERGVQSIVHKRHERTGRRTDGR